MMRGAGTCDGGNRTAERVIGYRVLYCYCVCSAKAGHSPLVLICTSPGGKDSFASGTTTNTVTFPLEFDSPLITLAIDIVSSGTPQVIASKTTQKSNVDFVTTSGNTSAYSWVAIGY